MFNGIVEAETGEKSSEVGDVAEVQLAAAWQHGHQRPEQAMSDPEG